MRDHHTNVIGAYEHDALGRRTRSTYEDDSEVRFYHDGLHEIEEFDENGSLLRKYTFREEIDSVAMMEALDVADVDDDQNTSELVRVYYHYDGRRNVCALTGPGEAVVESYQCSPDGNLSVRDMNGDPVSASQVGNPIVFQRRRHDHESGIMYFRARNYDSDSGQWMQRDPVEFVPGANWREMENSNPVNEQDPMGLFGATGSSGRGREQLFNNAASVTGLSGSSLGALGSARDSKSPDGIGSIVWTQEPQAPEPEGPSTRRPLWVWTNPGAHIPTPPEPPTSGVCDPVTIGFLVGLALGLTGCLCIKVMCEDADKAREEAEEAARRLKLYLKWGRDEDWEAYKKHMKAAYRAVGDCAETGAKVVEIEHIIDMARH